MITSKNIGILLDFIKNSKKNSDLYFKYTPKKQKIKKFIEKKAIKDSPFKVLKNINFK